MSLGRKFETFEPLYKGKLILSGVFGFIFLIFFLSGGLIGKIFFGLLLAGCGYTAYEALALKNSRLSFFEKGIQVKMPNSVQFEIPRDMIEDFSWQADEITEQDGYSSDTKHKITFLISYETDSGDFEEINWTEEFEQGSIQRLQRAMDREMDVQDEDDYYDE
ncbi:MAG: hypothetical protein KC646_01430 [Candidatus Cloacimonetes bacterium]|nr:hypothetical protein [Candidatus Cloacimonadota bacterium]